MEAWSLSSVALPLRLSWADTPVKAPSAPGVERHLLGYGQRHSLLRTSVSNPLPIGLYFTYHETCVFLHHVCVCLPPSSLPCMLIIALHSYPSFALVYFHTLKLQFSDSVSNLSSSSFSPARSGQPGSLALSFYLPPSTSVTWYVSSSLSIDALSCLIG
jgi:hypothetical protein